MNLEQTERLLEQLHGQLDNAIEKGARDTARYLYGQIAGALMLALYLRIIDEQENDRRYDPVRAASHGRNAGREPPLVRLGGELYPHRTPAAGNVKGGDKRCPIRTPQPYVEPTDLRGTDLCRP